MATRTDSIPAAGSNSRSPKGQAPRSNSLRNRACSPLAMCALLIAFGWAGGSRAQPLQPPYVYFYLGGEQIVIPLTQWKLIQQHLRGTDSGRSESLLGTMCRGRIDDV